MAGKEKQQRELRQLSISRKLAFQEVWRRFWLLLGTDILIALIFFGGLIAYSESYAADMDFSQPPVGGHVLTSDFDPYGGIAVHLPHNIAERLSGGINGRFVTWEGQRLYSVPVPWIENLQAFQYIIPIEDKFLILSYPRAIYFFTNCFGILLLIELVGLLCDWPGISRSIRKALRPIYDLTEAARNMNMTAVMPLGQSSKDRKSSGDLHLSGAIATLNDIDENDLGRRIVISDERAELKGLAEAINAMLDRLDAAYSSQLRFVSDASHELRTPIAVIQGYSNLLDRWGKNDEKTLQEAIDAIKTEAAGMQDLVEQLLFLARSDNQSITLTVETVDIIALADEVCRETQMIDKGHDFTARLEGELPVRGDAQLLKQALRIFVDNAIKYTPIGGRITISAEENGGFARLSVTDTGIGIPADDLPRIFDRFFRADESRARGTGGTGLGLSIAKWIVDRHGGFVEITSRQDLGTKITAAFPAFRHEETPPEPPAQPGPVRLPESL